MQPPKCKTCGKAEWDHVCRGQAADGNAVPPDEPHAELAAPWLAPLGECPSCDRRRAAGLEAVRASRKRKKTR